MDELTDGDYEFICRSLYPSIPESLLRHLISFNKRLHEDTMLHLKFAQEGSPWEFNLRDVIRSCQIIQGCYFSFLAFGKKLTFLKNKGWLLNMLGFVFRCT